MTIIPSVALAVHVVAEMIWEHLRVPAPFVRILAWLVSLGLWEVTFLIERASGQYPGVGIGPMFAYGMIAFVVLTVPFTVGDRRTPFGEHSGP